MGTTIKLYYVDRNVTYKEWELIPNKLLVVEDIASYLATKTALTINNFQYIKNKLELGINIDLAQSYSQPKTSTSFKYISIQNEGEMTHYYFVKEAEWRSKSCVRFELVMDVLNTFEENKDYTFKANTRIVREHKDRITRTPLELNITIGNNVGDVGSIIQGNNINLYREISGDFTLICRAEVLYIAEEYISLKVISNESYQSIINSISAGIQYSDLFQITKDSSNYREAFFTNLDIFYKFERKIDYINENINPVLQCGDSEGKLLEDRSLVNVDWYLLYRNVNDPSESQASSLVNPVECYLIPSQEIPTDSAYITGGRLIPSWVEEGKYYVFRVNSGETYTLSNGVSVSYTGIATYRVLLITRSGNKLNVAYFFTDDLGNFEMTWQYDDISFIDITGLPAKYDVTNIPPVINDGYVRTHSMTYDFTDSEGYSTLDSIEQVDRTDAKNIKLIKLPYIPAELSGESVLAVEGSDKWDYSSLTQANGGILHCLKLLDLNTKLEHEIKKDSQINPFSNFEITDTDELEPAITDLRETEFELESKLFHSEFYSPQLVYDSFAFKFDLEKVEQNYYFDDTKSLQVKFFMTRTINSKFMFEMKNYKLALSESNYSRYLPIARNNEEVLYNVSYLNYVRSGFNYDIKAKNLQNVSNMVGLGLSAGSIGLSLLAPSVPLKVAGIAASLVSMAMSIKSTITSAIQSENNIRAKLEQYSNQAASVVGSDDVDLMSEYAENRLKYVEYKPNPRMTALLKELFFYAGYNSGRMGIPTHNNRMNFDYLECEASIQAISSIPRDCLDELINSFKNGVTYLHKTTRTTDKWDFEQKYENWERTLLED